MRRTVSFLLLLILFLGWADLARSEDDSQMPRVPRWDFRILGSTGKVANDHGRDTSVMFAGVGASRRIAGKPGGMTLDYAGEVAPVFLVFQNPLAYGFEVVPFLLKWRFSSGPRARPYLEFGGGLLYTNDDVPENTSQFNFTPQIRFGMEFPSGKNRAFSLAFQYVHISNADTATRNRGYNSLNVQLGFHWFR